MYSKRIRSFEDIKELENHNKSIVTLFNGGVVSEIYYINNTKDSFRDVSVVMFEKL